MTGHPSWLTRIALPMPATLGTVNVYLIQTRKGAALIDTGLKDATSRLALESALDAQGLSLDSIGQVALTHHHVDHAGLAATLQENGAEMASTREEALLLDEFTHHPERDVERIRLFANHPIPEELIQHMTKMWAFFRTIGSWSRPDRELCHGDELLLCGLRFQVIAAPGHTTGHLALRQPDADILFTGDSVISPRFTHISGSPGDPNGDPYADYLHTLDMLQSTSAAVAYPGHGRAICDVVGRTTAVAQHLADELSTVRQQLSDTPRTAFELSRCNRDPRGRGFPLWLRFSQTVAYLTHLVAVGDATMIETETGIAYRRR
jgi:glyoxylase-like metal-dependent hydrolase (beta-lactamase superfamily II)